jgi:HAMP domain-containing protein
MEVTKTGDYSLSRTFNRALIVVYVVSILISLPITYLLTKREVYHAADLDLKLLVDMVGSVRGVVKEETRPYFLPKGEFLPVVVSSTVMAKSVAARFKKAQPDYLIRMVSDNPLNPEDRPEGLEAEVLDSMRAQQQAASFIRTGNIRGQDYLISASPTKAEADCMLCHGDPAKAPEAITAKYGKTSGFGWKDGSIVGASLVGVPLANTNSIVLMRSAVIVGIITVLFAIILLLLNVSVRHNIINPIIEITGTAKAMSLGKHKDPLRTARRDEIGALVHALELLRRSLAVATDHIAKLRNKPPPGPMR